MDTETQWKNGISEKLEIIISLLGGREKLPENLKAKKQEKT